MIDWAQFSAGIVTAGAIGTVVLNWSKIIGGVVSFFTRDKSAHSDPQRRIAFVPEVQLNSLWWHQASSQGGERWGLQVVGDFNVTNTWSGPVTLAAAQLRYREGLRTKTAIGMVDVKDSTSHYHGRYPLPPNVMTHARVHFLVPGMRREPAKPLVADVSVIDQFGGTHWIKRLTFKNTGHMLDP